MNHSPLLLQLAIILGTARVLGLILRYFGQPPVIGEMAAGIALGPAVFGAFAPELHRQMVMALVTTIMTGPLLTLFHGRHPEPSTARVA